MPLDLTNVYASVSNIKKALFFDTDTTTFNQLVFKNLDVTLLTLTEGFYVSKNTLVKQPTSNEERKVTIADIPDSVDLEAVVKLTTSVEYGGEKYKMLQFIRPRGATKKYKILIQAIGK